MPTGPTKKAICADDVIVFVQSRRYRKREADLGRKMRESREFDQILERNGQMTVGELRMQSGYPWERIVDHVDNVVSKGFAKWGLPRQKT